MRLNGWSATPLDHHNKKLHHFLLLYLRWTIRYANLVLNDLCLIDNRFWYWCFSLFSPLFLSTLTCRLAFFVWWVALIVSSLETWVITILSTAISIVEWWSHLGWRLYRVDNCVIAIVGATFTIWNHHIVSYRCFAPYPASWEATVYNDRWGCRRVNLPSRRHSYTASVQDPLVKGLL